MKAPGNPVLHLDDLQFALDQHAIVAITDHLGNITYVNDKFCEISQYTREELIGQNHRILKSGHHSAKFFRDLWGTIARGEVWHGEIKNRKKGGDYYWLETTIVPFLDDQGKPCQYVAIRTEITQQKRDQADLLKARDAALEATRLKSEFLATMSHEIRTPMNGVLGMIELLLDSPLDQNQRQEARTAMESANALLEIINDILDFSKIEAGRMNIEETDFDLADTVESVADILAPKTRQKGLSLMTRIDAAVPARVCGDSGRLRQILLNLAGNAVKFTSHGEVVIDVGVESMSESGVSLRCSVSDTGIGMSAQAIEHLFQPFMQADGTTTRQYGGTGLGLSICSRLLQLMGGKIGVDSVSGAGSTFWFTLPLKHAHDAPDGHLSSPYGTELQGVRVLVVDDSRVNRDILQHYLQAWGAHSIGVASSKAALEQLREAVAKQRAFDLALIDLAMPDVDGFELAKQIQRDTAIADTRLVMITASDDAGRDVKAMERGFRGYFNKPIRRAQLFDGLCRILQDDVMPLAKETEAPAAAVATSPGGGQTLLPGIKSVLLAEDNLTNQNVALRQLERLGYTVHVAANGREAVEAVQRENFALVLMDCMMPEMDGYQASAKIREWEAQTGRPRLPIIAMTANAMEGNSDKCLVAGMDDYLPKPVSMGKLQAMLGKWKARPALSTGGPVEQRALGSIDMSVLDKLRDEIGEYVGEVIDSYLGSTPALLEQLMRAYEARDFDEMHRHVHTLKSSSQQLGLNRLGEMATSLELRIRTGDLAFGIGEIERLFEEFMRAKSELSGMPMASDQPSRRPGGNQPLVLVVDDDASIRLLLRRAMEEEGYRVEEAADGAQAVALGEKLHPGVVLMDCMMPGMSGFEACEQLQLLPEEQRMPIIMVTGLADDTSIRQAIQAGAADFITKPVQMPLLCQRVKRLLEVKQTREHIKHLAYHDTLTGLPNRTLFNDRLQLAISAAKRDHHRLAMLFLNLDNFKTINDGLGHAVGDLLLRAVAERLSANVREGDTLSRVGGDEFALLLPKLTKGDEAVHGVRMIAEKMIDCMKLPFSLDGQEVYIGISIGISIYPEDGEDGATLLKNAGSAMHWAKATGRNSFSLYAGAMNAEVTERLQLENGLRKAMERNELVIYYQPQVNAHAERTEGMEALLRWQHPELGLVAPYKFIPLAEETGLIVEIGAWVLRTACAQCKAWHERGHDRLVVAVNLSARQLVPGDLVDVVRAALEQSGLPAWALDLEITESITMQGSSKAYDTLHQLKALGVQISMDDFGTGYSSLSYLKRFPIDILKIDQSFVRDIMTDPSDATIVETIIAMADTLGMRVIAEGVETVEQLEFLRSHGCQIIQGYLVSRPLPAEGMDQFLARGRDALPW